MRDPVRHVLMTADAVGGVWTYAMELCAALAGRGVQVSLAVLGPPMSSSQRAEAARLGNVMVFEHRGRLEWMDDPWMDVAAAGEWLLALEQRVAPDVVHVNGYAHAALSWSAPVLVTAHSCVLSWWRAVHGSEAPRRWGGYEAAVRAGLAAATLVTAPTRAMLAAVQQHYGALPRTRVIPNGRTATADGSQLKDAYIFSAGRLWDEAKNVAAVCAVASQLPWPVYVAGSIDGPGGGVPRCDAVTHVGVLDGAEMARWMARAPIYVLPARYEPFGLSILEAALAGCALVLGDIPSLREIWGDAALYAAPDDRSMLAAQVTRLTVNEPLRRQLADRARLRARAFTPDRMAAAYYDAYQELVGERRPLLSLRAV